MIKTNKLPTINDVAELAGVSKRTVSRVLNLSENVNEETRARVQDIIRQLNFTPSRQARGLAASRSYLLGLIYDVPTLFIADIQKGILNVCEDAGYELVVHACHIETDSLVEDVMRFVNRAHLDGVIMLPPVSDIDELAESLDKAGCRFVRIMSVLSEEPWKQVVTDYLPGITEMTSHLVELGHREFAFISGPRTNISSQMRRDMFVRALAKYDFEISPEMIIEGAFTFQSGIDAARKLLFLEHRPTAIFAANDEMAFGVMNVAAEMGLKIPRDLSLVGFDGTSFSTFVVPSLTTIVRQTDVMSRLGTQKLLARINEGQDAAREFDTMVPTRFIARESTGPAPANDGNNGSRVK